MGGYAWTFLFWTLKIPSVSLFTVTAVGLLCFPLRTQGRNLLSLVLPSAAKPAPVQPAHILTSGSHGLGAGKVWFSSAALKTKQETGPPAPTYTWTKSCGVSPDTGGAPGLQASVTAFPCTPLMLGTVAQMLLCSCWDKESLRAPLGTEWVMWGCCSSMPCSGALQERAVEQFCRDVLQGEKMMNTQSPESLLL